MIAGCYTLHLYCENGDGGSCRTNSVGAKWEPVEFTAELGSTCRREARRAGWRISWRDGKAYCPRCAKEKRRLREVVDG